MNRKQAFKEETRRLILEAARKMFYEEDFSQCTMRRVAGRAGVSAASVVVHFKNKIALMEAALAQDIGRTWEDALKNMPAKGRVAERLHHIWLTMFNFYDTNKSLYRELLSSTVLRVEDDTPAISRDVEAFLNFLVTVIEQEKKSGQINNKVDSMVLSMSLFSQYFGAEVMFFRDPGMTPETAAQKALMMNRQTLTGIEKI